MSPITIDATILRQGAWHPSETGTSSSTTVSLRDDYFALDDGFLGDDYFGYLLDASVPE